MAGKEYYSISELSRLTTLDSATIAKRLEGVAAKEGAKNSKTYALRDALPALITGETDEMEEAKLRKLEAEAERLELKLKNEQAEVVPIREVRNHLHRIFRSLHQRLAVDYPRTAANQLYKAESAAQIADVLRHDLGRIFNDLRNDHKAFLGHTPERNP